MEKYYYLFIDLACISVPFLFSFHPRIQFFKAWKAFFISLFFVATFFLIWDEWFTQIGVWGFNPRYLLGIYLGHLPLEEVLFFICIPYACVFTYWVVKQFVKSEVLFINGFKFCLVLGGLMLILGLINFERLYTFFTFLFLGLLLIVLSIKKKKYLIVGILAYLIILPFFFLSNGILTGSFIPEEIVWYNDLENLKFRIFTIPFEDAFYGLLLILLTITGMEEILNYTKKGIT